MCTRSEVVPRVHSAVPNADSWMLNRVRDARSRKRLTLISAAEKQVATIMVILQPRTNKRHNCSPLSLAPAPGDTGLYLCLSLCSTPLNISKRQVNLSFRDRRLSADHELGSANLHEMRIALKHSGIAHKILKLALAYCMLFQRSGQDISNLA